MLLSKLPFFVSNKGLSVIAFFAASQRERRIYSYNTTSYRAYRSGIERAAGRRGWRGKGEAEVVDLQL